jgi:hypothetical protein
VRDAAPSGAHASCTANDTGILAAEKSCNMADKPLSLRLRTSQPSLPLSLAALSSSL